ncbi:hypothetical protein LTR17_007278 [Elasticomyces elasticus]|nr:hypothetical protein LTR17_007278 [Elasticomyces elasticus]
MAGEYELSLLNFYSYPFSTPSRATNVDLEQGKGSIYNSLKMSFPQFQSPWQGRRSTDKHEFESIDPHETVPLNDEEPSPADEIAGLRRSLHNLKLWLIAISVVSGVALLIVGGSNRLPVPLKWHKSPVPNIPLVPKQLNQDNRFATGLSPESNHMWHSLIPPPDTGFVAVQNPRQYSHLGPGLPSPSNKPGEEIYGVSLFHQLHCVMHIRHHLWSLEQAATDNNATALHDLAKGNDHINHCFDFVRQALMCNADLTLEWPRSIQDEGKTGFVDGNNIPHQCKDWTEIYKWASRNAADVKSN